MHYLQKKLRSIKALAGFELKFAEYNLTLDPIALCC